MCDFKKSLMPPRVARESGFTLAELVIVMVVLGILSVAAAINVRGRTQQSVTVRADELRRTLSHLQWLALSGNQRLRLSLKSGGSGYAAYVCTSAACTTTTALTDPMTGSPVDVSLSSDGVTIAVSPNDDLDFDGLGRPALSGSLLTASSPARTYTLSGGGRSVTVTVQPLTGFAKANY